MLEQSYTYQDFKEDFTRRGLNISAAYRPAINYFTEMFEKDIVGFYPKNLVNDKEKLVELYFFLNDKVIVLKLMENSNLSFKCINSKIASFENNYPRYLQDGMELRIKFENGEEIHFHSLKDSNISWNDMLVENVKIILNHLFTKHS